MVEFDKVDLLTMAHLWPSPIYLSLGGFPLSPVLLHPHWTKKLQTQETEFQEQMRIALVSTYSILFFPYYKVVTPSSLPSRLRSRYSQP